MALAKSVVEDKRKFLAQAVENEAKGEAFEEKAATILMEAKLFERGPFEKSGG